MAISKMKRFQIVTLKSTSDSLISELQALRCLDIEKDESDEAELSFHDMSSDISDINMKIASAKNALDFLAAYQTEKKSLFSPPREIEYNNYREEFKKSTYDAVCKICKLAENKPFVKAEIISLQNEAAVLEPWKELNADIPQSSTAFTTSVAGTISSKIPPESIKEALEDTASVLEIVNTTKTQHYVFLTSHNDEFDKAYNILYHLGFTQTVSTAGASDGYAKGKIEKLKRKIEKLQERKEEIDKEASEFCSIIPDIEIYYDLLTTELIKLKAYSKYSLSDKTAVLTGWIPEKSLPIVSELLDKREDAYEFTDPTEEDDVPVILENNRFSTQFEPVIELYSLPKYGTFDPTSIMSIFYIIIFGLMLSDVGYGLLISLTCAAAVKLMKPKKSMRKMLSMFGLCGISCMVTGVLFGGYFGDAPTVIMKSWFGIENVDDLSLWFNPLTNFTLFLGVSLGIGALHLICALGIKFYVLWASGKKVAAVCDAGSWIVLFLGAAVYFISDKAGLIMVAVGVLMLITTQGRKNKNIFMKIFGGFASLYDIIGYISDLLSYSRILALGLASLVIASVFNILGTMPGLSVGGVIFFIVIFCIGHLLNIAINMLGTFVHTSRLQYIEFFGKFYEDGGRPFEPFAPESKYVIFK